MKVFVSGGKRRGTEAVTLPDGATVDELINAYRAVSAYPAVCGVGHVARVLLLRVVACCCVGVRLQRELRDAVLCHWFARVHVRLAAGKIHPTRQAYKFKKSPSSDDVTRFSIVQAHKPLSSLGVKDGMTLEAKDVGPQFSYKGVRARGGTRPVLRSATRQPTALTHMLWMGGPRTGVLL